MFQAPDDRREVRANAATRRGMIRAFSRWLAVEASALGALY
jgi:hypothetical protein